MKRANSFLFHEKLKNLGFTQKEIRILRETSRIPKGKTLTYGEVAERAGMKNCARFAGNVLSNNPFPILIPCHRVVAKTGIGGYSGKGGIKRKKELLKKEGIKI